MLHSENDSTELNYKMCVYAINFPENAMWIGFAELFVYWKNDVYTGLIKTTIKTVLQSDNKPIYGYSSKINNNNCGNNSNNGIDDGQQ